MGRFHAQKLAELRDAGHAVELAGVVDSDLERGEKVAAECGAPYFAAPEALQGRVEAVVIAVPTILHHQFVGDALRAGLDVLVEKPIATNPEQGLDLLKLAERNGRVLQVGHLERFNPAMRAMKKYLTRPRFIEVHRMGPFPGRATDVDVVRDLMIHDIEIIQGLLGETPNRIDAVGVPVLSHEVDIANARLSFPGGCVANLTASRVSPSPMRKLRIFQPDGYFSVDFNAQTAVIFHRFESPGAAEPRIEMETLQFDREDALRAELCAFIDAIHARSKPEVSGEEALGALRTALHVIEAMPAFDALR